MALWVVVLFQEDKKIYPTKEGYIMRTATRLKRLESTIKANAMLKKAKNMSAVDRKAYIDQLTWYTKGLSDHPEKKENIPAYVEDSRRALREIKRLY